MHDRRAVVFEIAKLLVYDVTDCYSGLHAAVWLTDRHTHTTYTDRQLLTGYTISSACGAKNITQWNIWTWNMSNNVAQQTSVKSEVHLNTHSSYIWQVVETCSVEKVLLLTLPTLNGHLMSSKSKHIHNAQHVNEETATTYHLLRRYHGKMLAKWSYLKNI